MVFSMEKYARLFSVGAVGYGLLEICWRGYTHWSMVLTGGVCLTLISRIDCRLHNQTLFVRAGASAAAITGVELAVGILVNRIWTLNVWDYSYLPFNFLGQICLPYSLLWFLLCIPVLPMSRFIAQGGKALRIPL